MRAHADKLFINGKIYSMEKEGLCYEALAIKDGKIAFIGDNRSAQAGFDADEVIDLGGKVMLPGLGDAHLHFFAYCQTFTTVDLGGAKSKAEALERLKAKAAETPDGEWIRGNNFDQSKWNDCEDEIPTRHWLDEASKKHPIMIKRVCLHTGVANTLALEKADIGKDYDFGEGGVVELEADGHPNGILREQATKIFDDLIPDPTKIPEVKT